MKNKILKVALAFVFAFCSFAMFACGGDENLQLSYKDLPKIVTEMQSNSDLFKTGTVDGVSTNFIINAFAADDSEDSEGLDNSDENRYFNECLVIPINYIVNYQNDVELVAEIKNLNGEQSDAINKLETSMATMKLAYQDMCGENERLLMFTEEDVYRGALQLFKYSATKFITSTYEVAINLADVQNKVLNKFDGMVTRKLDTSDATALRDYTALKIGQDYANLLLVSMNSKTWTPAEGVVSPNVIVNAYIMTQIKDNLSAFVASYYGATSLKDLSVEDVKEGDTTTYNNTGVTKILNSQNILENERIILNKAMNNFSMYDFFQKPYECNVEEYGKDVKYASQYFAEIFMYYTSTSLQHVNFLREIIIK